MNSSLDSYSVGRSLVALKRQGYELGSTDPNYQQGFINACRQDSKKKCGPTAIACGDTCISSKKKCLYDRYGKKLEAEEKAIASLPKEQLVAINPQTGKVALRLNGDETSVYISPQEMKKLKGTIITHNHPDQGFPPGDPRAAGISFSPADVATACTVDAAEIRAVSSGYRFSMSPPDEGWDEKFFEEKVVPSYVNHYTNNYCKNFALVNLGLVDHRQASRQIHHDTWTSVAKDTGMRYTMSEIKEEKRKPKTLGEKASKFGYDVEAGIVRGQFYIIMGTLGAMGAIAYKQSQQENIAKAQNARFYTGRRLQGRTDSKARCKKGVPCGDVCLPRGAKCRKGGLATPVEKKQSSGAGRAILAAGLTGAAIAAGIKNRKRIAEEIESGKRIASGKIMRRELQERTGISTKGKLGNWVEKASSSKGVTGKIAQRLIAKDIKAQAKSAVSKVAPSLEDEKQKRRKKLLNTLAAEAAGSLTGAAVREVVGERDGRTQIAGEAGGMVAGRVAGKATEEALGGGIKSGAAKKATGLASSLAVRGAIATVKTQISKRKLRREMEELERERRRQEEEER